MIIAITGILIFHAFRLYTCLQQAIRTIGIPTFTVFTDGRKKPSRLFSFRVPGDVAGEIDQAVRISGKDKTAWMLAAVLEKLGKPGESLSPESRMEVLIGQMEALLRNSATAPGYDPAPTSASEVTTGSTARDVIAEIVEESKRQRIQPSNKAIAQRLTDLGSRPARTDVWTISAVDSSKRKPNEKVAYLFDKI